MFRQTQIWTQWAVKKKKQPAAPGAKIPSGWRTGGSVHIPPITQVVQLPTITNVTYPPGFTRKFFEVQLIWVPDPAAVPSALWQLHGTHPASDNHQAIAETWDMKWSEEPPLGLGASSILLVSDPVWPSVCFTSRSSSWIGDESTCRDFLRGLCMLCRHLSSVQNPCCLIIMGNYTMYPIFFV